MNETEDLKPKIEWTEVRLIGGVDIETASSFSCIEAGVRWIKPLDDPKNKSDIKLFIEQGGVVEPDPEFSPEGLFAKAKLVKFDELKVKYQAGKSNVFIQTAGGKIETKYSIESIQSIVDNKIKANIFPDDFIIDFNTKLTLKNAQQAKDYNSLLAQTLDTYWKSNFQANQIKILSATTIEELNAIDIIMPDFVINANDQ